MHMLLFEPEIPPNTGNVARLCAAVEAELHLVEPLGFSLKDRYLKRAGLDYWPHVRLFVWPNLEAYLEKAGRHRRLVASSSRSGEAVHRFPFSREDTLLLGPETRGLPEAVLDRTPHRVRIPIRGPVRSLNLSTAAGILLVQAMARTGLLDEESLPAEREEDKTPRGAVVL
jgi:tRNA (cytidine/uridine-2'-O-)-methyltransferase